LKSSIFWDITPCSPLKVSRSFGGLPYAFTLVTCSAYLTPKMEAIGYSETSVDLPFFVTTTVRTSDPTTYVTSPHDLSTVKCKCENWLQRQNPGSGGFNVFTVNTSDLNSETWSTNL
jgi:hypothetical protein